jgi:opacity protein-like surface antigen
MSYRCVSWEGPRRWRWPLVAALLAGLAVPTAQAQIPGVEIHGFGGWAYGNTDGNRYTIGTADGEYRNGGFTLNITASPTERLRLIGQLSTALEADDETEAEIDYAFVEWAFSDALRFRAGRIKQPIGLYNEIFDVGTLRPFFTLPQSVYGPNGISTKGYNGVGLTGTRYLRGNWGLQYDAYLGQIDGELVAPGLLFGGAETFTDRVTRDFDVRDLLGFRLNALAPKAGLLFGLSAYVGDQSQQVTADDADTRLVLGTHAEYLGEKWWLRGEYLHYGIDRYSEDGAYAEVAYKVTDHWQVAGRYDWWDFDITNFRFPPQTTFLNQTLAHREASLGLNYWFHANAVIKLAVQHVADNRFAFPQTREEIQRTLVTRELDSSTQLISLGTQFSF